MDRVNHSSSLSHRPTLLTKSIVLEDLKCFPWKMQLLEWDSNPWLFNTAASQPCYQIAPRWIENLAKNWLDFIGLQLNYWPSVTVCVGFGWLGGLSPSDISRRPFGRPVCYNVMNLQLGKCPILADWLRQTTNNKQHTNQIRVTCLKVVGSSPGADIFYLNV